MTSFRREEYSDYQNKQSNGQPNVVNAISWEKQSSCIQEASVCNGRGRKKKEKRKMSSVGTARKETQPSPTLFAFWYIAERRIPARPHIMIIRCLERHRMLAQRNAAMAKAPAAASTPDWSVPGAAAPV